MQRKYID
jgi:Anion-transporting ATPase